ncbi:hypothetical protein [Azotobacter chroococcum]|uniref:hypothetical protein n=1 Tax=Azotobacter chroococcum TaxID=353 RepID=UPI0013F178A2|nr:hypothetical protein [Azotobacter chroococcum]
MYEFIIHDDATGDLQDVLRTNRAAGLRLAKLLQQLQADQDLLDRLSQRDYGGSPARPRPRNAIFNTGFWVAAQDNGMNLWRLRYFDELVEGYRLIYAFLPPEDQYILLAIAEKAEYQAENDERFNYELSHPLSVRITAAYRVLADGD